MKPKNMTNKQLAVNLEATVPFLMKEARNLTDAKDADAALAYANYILRGDAGKEAK